MTQVKTRPPTFVLFASIPDALPEDYKRFLVNGLRRDFDMPGTPIRLYLRGGGGGGTTPTPDAARERHFARQAQAPPAGGLRAAMAAVRPAPAELGGFMPPEAGALPASCAVEVNGAALPPPRPASLTFRPRARRLAYALCTRGA